MFTIMERRIVRILLQTINNDYDVYELRAALADVCAPTSALLVYSNAVHLYVGT